MGCGLGRSDVGSDGRFSVAIHHPGLLTPGSECFPWSRVTPRARLGGRKPGLFPRGAGGSVDLAQGWAVWGPAVRL